MSRTLKLIVYAAIAEMALAALAIFAWRQGAIPWLPAPDAHVQPRVVLSAAFMPVWFLAIVLFLRARMLSQRPRISDSHRRYIERGLPVAAAAMVALQGLYAYMGISGAGLDQDKVVRTLIVFLGLWTAINGNRVAKFDPPRGPGAPPAAVWTRMALRFGWIMVLSGLALVISAFTLSRSLLMLIFVAVTLIFIGGEIVYRRMTRPGRPA